MKKVQILFVSLIAILVGVSSAYACRFYVAVGEKLPPKMIKAHLLDYPNSLKMLGARYEDGWSLGVYKNGKATVTRSDKSSLLDKAYDQAVIDASEVRSNIILGHLRRASSGCVEGVANPHPFLRAIDGKFWLFGHNGWINKALLIDIIGEEYLEEHPPLTCTDNPPDSWVDSELYFTFLMKKIKEHNGNVEAGIIDALIVLYRALPNDRRKLNFFLSDGQTVWAFRRGTSLFFAQDNVLGISAVASSFPDEKKGAWQVFPEDRLAILKPNEEIRFISLLKYWSNFHDFEQ